MVYLNNLFGTDASAYKAGYGEDCPADSKNDRRHGEERQRNAVFPEEHGGYPHPDDHDGDKDDDLQDARFFHAEFVNEDKHDGGGKQARSGEKEKERKIFRRRPGHRAENDKEQPRGKHDEQGEQIAGQHELLPGHARCERKFVPAVLFVARHRRDGYGDGKHHADKPEIYQFFRDDAHGEKYRRKKAIVRERRKNVLPAFQKKPPHILSPLTKYSMMSSIPARSAAIPAGSRSLRTSALIPYSPRLKATTAEGSSPAS